ncbi:Ank3 [Symbiodinium necroappetens]|uniref:Ank3 protein n=1 Tax=Symbiodinium necroappetens TaxID=1628268 RepID=A0A812WYM8_9DINO|nr:Ank3 [Symbiodinium necroappetens]
MGSACGAAAGNFDRQLHQAARNDEVNLAKAALAKKRSSLNSKDLAGLHTALHIAAYEGSAGVAQLLLDAKAALGAKDGSRDTPLHLAAYMGQVAHTRIAQLLLTKRAAADEKGADDKTALHLAARRGQLEAVQQLMGQGAQPAAADKEGDLPLHEAARNGHVAVAQELLRARVPVDAASRNGKTALHVACTWGQEAVVEVLLQNAASVNAADICGNSPLHEAARCGRRFLCERLVSCRAPLEARNRDQRTPLHASAATGNYDFAGTLMQYGASSDAPDKDGDTPVHLAAFYGRTGVLDVMMQLRVVTLTLNKEGRSPVHRAVQGGRVAALKLLVGVAGRPTLQTDTPDNQGETPMHLATTLGDGHEVVETLAQNPGTSLEARRGDGLLPLLLAALQGKARTVECLLRAKAQVQAVDSSGNTALHFAAGGGHLSVVHALLTRQASPNVQNQRNETPFQVAGTRGYVEVARAMNPFVSVESTMPSVVTQAGPGAFAQTLPYPTYPAPVTLPGMALAGGTGSFSSDTARARSLPPPRTGKEPLMSLLRRGQAASPAASVTATFRSIEECISAAGKVEEEVDPITRFACSPNFEFFKPLGKPRRGDWLAEKKETGQTYTTYSRRMKPPMTPTKHTDTILLVPIGHSFSEGIAVKFLSYLIDYCTAFFVGMTVDVLDKPLSLAKMRKRMNDFMHEQYLIADLFDALHSETRSHRKAYCRLGITMEDIYPGEEWNYVFGQAKPMERVGVFSFARHSPFFYNGLHASQVKESASHEQQAVWLRACMRTMVHETCHMFGILHCVYFHCVMNGSNGPHDSAGRSSFMCPVCLRKLLLALSYAPAVTGVLPRYQAILQVLERLLADFADPSMEEVMSDISWLQKRISSLPAS